MPCHAAMVKKFVKLSDKTTVDEALAQLKKSKEDFAVVIDDDATTLGVFSYHDLIHNTIPVSASVDGHDIKISSAPGIVKRLARAGSSPVHLFMNTKVTFVYPQTSLGDGARAIDAHPHAPVLVIEEGSRKCLGYMTARSLLDEFDRLGREEG